MPQTSRLRLPPRQLPPLPARPPRQLRHRQEGQLQRLMPRSQPNPRRKVQRLPHNRQHNNRSSSHSSNNSNSSNNNSNNRAVEIVMAVSPPSTTRRLEATMR